MKPFKICLSATIIIMMMCLISCTPDGSRCNDEETFCEFVNQDDIESTRSIIDDFLKKLSKNNDQENLEILRDWFICMECVEDATIFCNSCMESLPPQSALEVTFLVNGDSKAVNMNIWMGDPMTVGQINE